MSDISYPFGRCNERVVQAAQQAGFTRGFSMRFPSEADGELARGRVAVYGYDTPLSIYYKVKGGWRNRIESAKALVTNRLAGGTILLNRWRRMP